MDGGGETPSPEFLLSPPPQPQNSPGFTSPWHFSHLGTREEKIRSGEEEEEKEEAW